MMAAIDRHFLTTKPTAFVDPSIIKYVSSNDPTKFSSIDQMRINFMQLEIQRIEFEINAIRSRALSNLNASKAGCMLCSEDIQADKTYFAGKCGHVYCNGCFIGITEQGVNRLCAFDRKSLVNGNSFQLNICFNTQANMTCGLGHIPFGINEIYGIPSCGHMFHKKCITSNIHRCSYCLGILREPEIKLLVQHR